MCGICGTIGFEGSKLVEMMSHEMVHRGPDDSGLWTDARICLGHKRLAVIDTSSDGHQPMCNEDETVWIVFNGEIYDFLKLKETLITKGHRFKSKTNTEVILHLYEEYGEDCLRYLRGMFSFAIWDKRKQILFAARDRFGIKPFFYYFKNGQFIFSSELKSLLSTGLIEKTLNPKAVTDYFTYGSVQAPQTMIKNVFSLLPSHYLVLKNSKITIKKYWDLRLSEEQNIDKTEEEHILDISDILNEAVKIRLISDVPLGAFLSGGLDSTSIVALMKKHSLTSVKTFSIVFGESAYDESYFSQKVAIRLGTDHTQILLKAKDILKKMPVIFNSMDQPSIDGFNTYVISNAVRNAGLTVAISGLGGDELFAGYPSFKVLPKLLNTSKLLNALPQGFKDKSFNLLASLAKTRRSLKGYASVLKCKTIEDLYYLKRMVFLPHELERILIIDGQNTATRGTKKDYVDIINKLSYLEIENYLQNTLLQDADRMSMINSLEVRAPYLDHILVEKMFEIPGELKIGTDYTKRLLVKAVGKILPEEVCNRQKKGFVLPFEQWLRAELKDYCQEMLSQDSLKKIPLLDSKRTHKIWKSFLNGSKLYNYSSILCLLSFVNWYRKNIQNE